MNKPFETALRDLINRHSIDTEMETPDYALAAMIVGMLRTVKLANKRRRQHIGRPRNSAMQPLQLDPNRCAVCGWPLAESVEKGCVRGNCSQRPLPHTWYDAQRAEREGYKILKSREQ